MYVHLGAFLLRDPIVLAVFIALIVPSIYFAFKFFKERVKGYKYIALIMFASTIPILTLSYAAYNCGLSISDSEITLKHMGCVSAFVGIPCKYSFNVRGIERVIVTTWNNFPCKVEIRTFGLGSFIMNSGYFKTTCGTVLIHSIGKYVVAFKLKSGKYVIIGASKEIINQIVNELIRLGLKPVIEFGNETSHTTSR